MAEVRYQGRKCASIENEFLEAVVTAEVGTSPQLSTELPESTDHGGTRREVGRERWTRTSLLNPAC